MPRTTAQATHVTRELVLVTALAVAAGQRFTLECMDSTSACPGACCGAGYALDVSDNGNSATCIRGSTTCTLCSSGSDTPSDACSVTTDTAGVPYPSFTNSTGNALSAQQVLGTYDGMAGWPDLSSSSFHNFRDFLLGLPATVPPYTVPAGTTITYPCSMNDFDSNIGESLGACDLFLFIYRCPPCTAQDGSLPTQLLSSYSPQWKAGSCGPSFQFSDESAMHPFVMYQAEVAAGSSTTVEVSDAAEFVFAAMVGKAVLCSDLGVTECNANSDTCTYDATYESCMPRSCETGTIFFGPPQPKCTTCVDDERSDYIQ